MTDDTVETVAKDIRRRLKKLLLAQHNFINDPTSTNWARVVKMMDDYQMIIYPREKPKALAA